MSPPAALHQRVRSECPSHAYRSTPRHRIACRRVTTRHINYAKIALQIESRDSLLQQCRALSLSHRNS